MKVQASGKSEGLAERVMWRGNNQETRETTGRTGEENRKKKKKNKTEQVQFQGKLKNV